MAKKLVQRRDFLQLSGALGAVAVIPSTFATSAEAQISEWYPAWIDLNVMEEANVAVREMWPDMQSQNFSGIAERMFGVYWTVIKEFRAAGSDSLVTQSELLDHVERLGGWQRIHTGALAALWDFVDKQTIQVPLDEVARPLAIHMVADKNPNPYRRPVLIDWLSLTEGMTADNACWYLSWVVRYLSVVAMPLVSAGGSLHPYAIAARNTILIANSALTVACA